MAYLSARVRSLSRRALVRLVVLISGGLLVLMSFEQGPLPVSHMSPTVLEQHWELLGEVGTVTAEGWNVHVRRGSLPGGSSGFDPQPTVTLEVVGAVTGAVGSDSGYEVQLRGRDTEGIDFGLVQVSFRAGDSTPILKTVSFDWPAEDTKLDAVRVWSVGVQPGTFELRKVYLKIHQEGTITKTIGRFPIGGAQKAISSTSWNPLTDKVIYQDLGSDFDPAPTIRLRVTNGGGTGVEGSFRLADSLGHVATGSTGTVSGGTSVTTGPITLDGDVSTYRLEIKALDSTEPWDLVGADLIFEQSTTDTHGLKKTVGWYPSVTAPVTNSQSGTDYRFMFGAPAKTSRYEHRRWLGTAQRGTSQNVTAEVQLRDRSANVTRSSFDVGVSSPNPSAQYGDSSTVSDLSAGNVLDTRANFASGALSLRVNMSALRIAYELRDVRAPTISGYAVSEAAISPNADGTKDSTTFTAILSDDSAPISWTLEVKNDAGVTKRSYSGSGTSVSQVWDGKDASGAVVADGLYTGVLTATDPEGNARSSSKTVQVDTAPPTVSSLAASWDTFSPNGNGTKDSTTLTASISEVAPWTLDLKNESGVTVRSYSGTGSSVSQVWDGKNTSGQVVADGLYTATVRATDNAGNAHSQQISMTVDTVAPSITDLAAAPNPFSPNADGTKDSTMFTATLSDPATPISWTLRIKDGSTILRTYTGSGSSVSQTWDGKDSLSVTVADSAYSGELTATDDVGNSRVQTAAVTVDAESGPSITGYAASQTPLSPNADGVKDSTTLSATLSDASTPITWTIEIENGAASVVRSFSGSGTSVSEVWDGTNGSAQVVSDGAYTAILTTTDDQGISSSAQLGVTVDTVAPSIADYSVSQTPFSPNGDGTKDSTTFAASLSDASTTTWTIEIKNGAGSVVRSYSGSGTSVSQPWDGKNASDQVVADGAYTGTLMATDAAGNSAQDARTATVDTTAPAVSGYGASPSPFSPNEDGTKDETTFTATLTDPSAPVTWTLNVKNSADTVVRTYTGSGTVSQAWDGKNALGVVVADGAYSGALAATDDAGNSSSASAAVALDTAAPAISNYTVYQTPFSPNADGVKDTTTLSATLSDASTPVAWSLALKNGAGATVRSYSGSGSSVSQVWDGKNASGQVVADGAYTATLTATDDQGISSTDSRSVTVDTVLPGISGYDAAPDPFSPGGDGIADTTTFAATLSDASTPLSWTLEIENASGSVVRTYAGSGSSVSQVWDGKNASGAFVADGTHTGVLGVTDPAGNAAEATATVVVDRTGPGISGLAASPNPFSPNADGTKDTTTITATLSDASTPITWTLRIKAGSTTLRTFTGSGASVSEVWDGTDAGGAAVASGTYSAELTATDDVGNARTQSISAVVDKIAPGISGFAASPNPFSPNADGSADTTTISASLLDTSPPVAWTLVIKDAAQTTVRSFSGGASPVSALWDGKNTAGQAVSEGTYTATLIATDNAGNTTTSSPYSVVVDLTAPTISAYAVSPAAFSPNGDGAQEEATFTATLADPATPIGWALSIRDGIGTMVRSYAGSGGSVSQSWDGKNASGQVVSEGTYTATLAATDAVGNRREDTATVTVDDTDPQISGFAATPDPFSPNGDGTADTTTFAATVSEASSWSLVVQNALGAQVRDLASGSGTSPAAAWDGRTDAGLAVPNATYTGVLSVTDAAGNTAQATATVGLESYPFTVLADAPSHYYRLGETSGTQANDSSGNARHGQYNGATLGRTGTLPGDPNTAVLFPESSTSRTMTGLAGSEQGLATGDGSRTVEAWVKTDPDHTETVYIARWGTFPGAYNIGINGSHVTITWSSGSNTMWINTNRALNDARWHHVVLSYDGTTSPNTFTVYVDGQLRSTATRATDFATVATQPTFGSSGSSGDQIWLDEVALYPRALSQTQVEAHWAASRNLRPTMPTPVSAAAAGDNRATVSWSAASATVPEGQAAVDHYAVSAIRNGARMGAVGVAGTQTSVTMRGLPAGTYAFEVYAINGFSRGTAALSATSSVTGAGVTYSSVVLDDAPTHYYRLAESSGFLATDSAGLNRHGTYYHTGVTSLGHTGALSNDTNTAALFPVDNQTGPMTALPGSGGGVVTGNDARSVEAWVKTTTTQAVRVAGWGDIPNAFMVKAEGSNVLITWSSGGSNTLSIPTGVPLNNGAWHHVVVTYDSSDPNLNTFTVYVDGQPRNTATRSTGFTTSWSLPAFGDGGWNADVYLDEISLYSRALTERQVRDHWTYASLTTPSGRSKGALS